MEECWGEIISPAMFLLGAGFGGFIGGLACMTTYWLGWHHYNPMRGFPVSEEAQGEGR